MDRSIWTKNILILPVNNSWLIGKRIIFSEQWPHVNDLILGKVNIVFARFSVRKYYYREIWYVSIGMSINDYYNNHINTKSIFVFFFFKNTTQRSPRHTIALLVPLSLCNIIIMLLWTGRQYQGRDQFFFMTPIDNITPTQNRMFVLPAMYLSIVYFTSSIKCNIDSLFIIGIGFDSFETHCVI